jgi:bifunctional DNA-binding transcriptional regulator/antitoxin component of YhaV-PrlF toxin-antitoxin module
LITLNDMAKVTSKLQLTLPKAIADRYQIRPGDDLEWLPAGEAIRVLKRGASKPAMAATVEQRLHLFDEATARQARRERKGKLQKKSAANSASRGWTREDLYNRGLPR